MANRDLIMQMVGTGSDFPDGLDLLDWVRPR
jgi:hypothetical protein